MAAILFRPQCVDENWCSLCSRQIIGGRPLTVMVLTENSTCYFFGISFGHRLFCMNTRWLNIYALGRSRGILAILQLWFTVIDMHPLSCIPPRAWSRVAYCGGSYGLVTTTSVLRSSCRKVLQSPEVARFVFTIVQSHLNLTGASAAVRPRSLSNFKATAPSLLAVTRLRYRTTSLWILKFAPNLVCHAIVSTVWTWAKYWLF